MAEEEAVRKSRRFTHMGRRLPVPRGLPHLCVYVPARVSARPAFSFFFSLATSHAFPDRKSLRSPWSTARGFSAGSGNRRRDWGGSPKNGASLFSILERTMCSLCLVAYVSDREASLNAFCCCLALVALRVRASLLVAALLNEAAGICDNQERK